MTPCEPYTASELRDIFDDASRWTIQRRLDSLHDDGRVRKKKHAENRVSWWVEDEAAIEEEEPEPEGDPALRCPDCNEQFDEFAELKRHMDETDPDH